MLASVSAADARVVTEEYLPQAPALGANWLIGCEIPPNLGDICFGVQQGETRLDLRISDISGLPTAGSVVYMREEGWQYLGWGGFFCDTASGLVMPTGTDTVLVNLRESAFGTMVCTGAYGEPTLAGQPTAGTVMATFR
jgi:hypothetical protein